MGLFGSQDYSGRVRSVLVEIVAELGGLEPAAKACGCQATFLSEALKDEGASKSKFIRIEIVGALGDRASRGLALKLKRALVGEGFDVIEREMTAAEELARLKAEVRRKYGPSGEETIEEARR